VAPDLAAAAAERVFLRPPRYRAPAKEAGWAAGAEPLGLPWPAGPLAAWSWGTGERTALLVHGWAGRGFQLGAFVAPLVGRGFRVVAFDGPGHGRSPGRRSSLVEMVAAVAVALERLGGADLVVGHSLGAAAAAAALDRVRPRRPAARLAAVAPSIDFDGVLDRFGAMTGFTPEVTRRMRRRIEARFGIAWTELSGLNFAARMEVPLLVVHDRDDRDVPWEEGSALAAVWPGARLLTTRGLGHRKVLRDPAVLAAVAEFAAAESAAVAESLSSS
jgi:pimeloyl-ACP methyl ester carboxylesterase